MRYYQEYNFSSGPEELLKKHLKQLHPGYEFVDDLETKLETLKHYAEKQLQTLMFHKIIVLQDNGVLYVKDDILGHDIAKVTIGMMKKRYPNTLSSPEVWNKLLNI